MDRQEALARLRASVAADRPIIGGGAGTGLSAKAAEAGGIDLIIIYNSGRYRMAGRGSLAGLLIAGGSLVHPSYMDSVVVFGFVAAVLGGLDSPLGSVIGGLVLGVSLSFVSGYVGSQLVPLAALAILMLVLTLRPGGLFAQAPERRV